MFVGAFMTVFVSIASYRDPELVPTVLDCLAKADDPAALRIVVCWQHHGDEDISAIRDLPQVEILEFDAQESQGACWARSQIMGSYRPVDWFLQVDSHTRFVPGWDTRSVTAARATGSENPLLTCYPPMYEPGRGDLQAGVPTRITVSGWSDDGLPLFGQEFLEDWPTRQTPVRARFVGACFLFTAGDFPTKVPYDPFLYFHGEEITLSVRAYTAGYDLFHPAETLAYHYYTRKDNPRHWDDHKDAAHHWSARDRSSRRRALNMLRFPSTGWLSLGAARTMADYREYSGVDFRTRTLTDYAASGGEPPGTEGGSWAG
jgi:hypothetical protein